MTTKTALITTFLGLALAGCGRKDALPAAAANEARPDPIAVKTATAEARTVERSIGVDGLDQSG